MRRALPLIVVALLASLFMVLSPRSSGRRIRMTEFRFSPASVMIARGGALSFANDSDTTHTATCVGCPLDAGDVQPGLIRTITFPRTGSYTIVCRYHGQAGMRMTVQVGRAGTAAASPVPSPSAS